MYTAWSNEPKRLGMIYCYQRPCSLRLVSIVKLLDLLDPPAQENQGNENSEKSKAKESSKSPSCPHFNLTSQLRLARYPQFNNSSGTADENESNTNLVFLGHESGFDTHNASSGLYILDWSTLLLTTGPGLWEPQLSATLPDVDTERLVKAVIEEGSPTMANSNPVLINNFHFPGLYAMSIAPCSFISPTLLLLETNWRAVSVILVINIETCEIRVISMQDGSFHLSNIFYTSYTVKKQISHLGEKTSGHVDHATPVGLSRGKLSESSWQAPTPFSINLICTVGGREGGIVMLASNTSSRPRLGFINGEELLPLLAPSKISGFMSMIPFAGHSRKLNSCFSDVFPIMAISATTPNGTTSDSISITEEALGDMESYVLQSRTADNESVLIESMLLFPTKDFPGEGTPLLVVPHG